MAEVLDMPRNRVVLHTGLPPDVVADVLLRSLETKRVPLWQVFWLIGAVVTIAAWVTGPPWDDPSRQVLRQVHGRTFRLQRRHGRPFSPTFYGSWKADRTGTKIEGYFGLSPMTLISLRVWLFTMVIITALGVVLNVLDLTVKTHFTVDPDVGLTISICLMLLSIGGYLLAQWLGSWRDASSLSYLEQKLSAVVEDPNCR
ncbi:MAG: hypothetical protein P4L87_24210 [Formivibrio sp.]|nr:hypothetical protein [Formivibrio sp.]